MSEKSLIIRNFENKEGEVFTIISRDREKFDFSVIEEVCHKGNTHFYFKVTISKKGLDSKSYRREIGKREVDKFKRNIRNRGYFKNNYKDLSEHIKDLDCYGLSCKCLNFTVTVIPISTEHSDTSEDQEDPSVVDQENTSVESTSSQLTEPSDDPKHLRDILINSVWNLDEILNESENENENKNKSPGNIEQSIFDFDLTKLD